jgi:hypothetical protein
MSRYGVDEPSAEIWLDHISDLRKEQQEHMEEWESRHPPPPSAYRKSLERKGRVRYAHPVGFDWQRQRMEEELNKRLEIADRGYDYQWENW